ncbi:ABC transporter permease [Mycolicibacterium murale]|uniref:ABC transporter permease n=1 Tax=Mycolicibacterium murale TaxID=182220 RepID=A0A7I9WW01_9MYCO|nr:ABC transporter permease [Mycolicibacterium murale]MCV7181960.1 ABC transporter permease [Mycolicibacterium murale]GFG61456.1 ABC transporter permease [Mycolicibacterium murale]
MPKIGASIPLRLRALGIPVLGMVLLVVVWDLAVRIFDIAPYVLPSPARTFEALRDDWSSLGPGAVITSQEFILGFLIGATAGFFFALVMSWSPLVQRGLYPILITSQAVPIIAVAPALVIWMGFGLAPKLTIVALIVFFPVVVNVLDGLASVDKDLIALVKAMGGTRWRVFRSVTLPATLTPLFSALKMTATFAVTGAVLGEWTASTTGGLGVSLLEAQSRLDVASVFAAIILLVILGLLAFGTVAVAEVLLTPWRRSSVKPAWRRTLSRDVEPEPEKVNQP